MDVLDLSRLRSDELMALELRDNKVLDSEDDTVGTEASKDNHFAKGFLTLGLPLTWKLVLLRLGLFRAKPILPLFGAELNSLADVGEGRQHLV